MQNLPVEEVDYQPLQLVHGLYCCIEKIPLMIKRFMLLKQENPEIDVVFWSGDFISMEGLMEKIPELLSVDPRDFSVPFPEL